MVKTTKSAKTTKTTKSAKGGTMTIGAVDMEKWEKKLESWNPPDNSLEALLTWMARNGGEIRFTRPARVVSESGEVHPATMYQIFAVAGDQIVSNYVRLGRDESQLVLQHALVQLRFQLDGTIYDPIQLLDDETGE